MTAVSILLSILLVVCFSSEYVECRTKFVVNLDHQIFDKFVLPGRKIVLKFDTEHPHGEFQDAFVEFAQLVAQSSLVDEQRGKRVTYPHEDHSNHEKMEEYLKDNHPDTKGPPHPAKDAHTDPDSVDHEAFTEHRLIVAEVRIKNNVPVDENPNLMLLNRFGIDPQDLPAFGYLEEVDGQHSGKGFQFVRRRAFVPSLPDGTVGDEVAASALELARWAGLRSKTHLHFGGLFGHRHLNVAESFVSDAVKAILSDDIINLSALRKYIARYSERAKGMGRDTKQSPVYGEIVFIRRLIDLLYDACKAVPPGNQRAIEKAALDVMNEQERLFKQLQADVNNKKLIESMDKKLVLIHRIQMRLHHQTAHIPHFVTHEAEEIPLHDGDL